MVLIQKYIRTKECIEIELLLSNPYTGNSLTDLKRFKKDHEAQYFYWSTVWSFLNFGVEAFIGHCRILKEYYFDSTSSPFYNDQSWRDNYENLDKEFNSEYFNGIIVTIENKAHHIIEYKQVLINAIPIYKEAKHLEAKTMVAELIQLSNTIIENRAKIQNLTPFPNSKTV